MMKASIRVHSLSTGGSGSKTVSGMTAHGMRQDWTSKQRQVEEAKHLKPLVFGGLDIQRMFEKHTSGCSFNKANKRPVLHALLQFPTEIPATEANQKRMMKAAVKFINLTHGGDAVFAARLDRDEKNQHHVDVFYSPKYEKKTKTGSKIWVSTTKFAKALCLKHRAEIEERHPQGKFSNGPRQQGMSLQSEFALFLKQALKLKIEPKKRKDYLAPDRLEPEAFGAAKDAHRSTNWQEKHQQDERATDAIRDALKPSPRL